MATFLCYIDEIADPGSKGFQVKSNNEETNIFVVHQNGQFRGYINSCPHTGASLDWQQDQFLDRDHAFIQCSTHDALFNIDTGLCVSGPCVGDQLSGINISISTRSNKKAIMLNLRTN